MPYLPRLNSTSIALLSISLLAGLTIPAAASNIPSPDPAQPQEATAAAVGDSDDPDNPEPFATESETGRWIVQFNEPPVASYDGEVSGLAATAPQHTGDDKLDVNDPDSVAYAEHLDQQRERLIAEIEEELGREVSVEFEYQYALNGIAVKASAAEAALIADLGEVAQVAPDEMRELDTDVSQELISAPALWDGQTPGDIGSRGEGVIVGMLDSGVNPFHPSFAATDGDDYTHTNPFGEDKYVGVCAADHPRHDDICNSKLIGAWDFTSTLFPNARDTEGHGSHVGSTIAGNKHDAVVSVGEDEYVRTVQGVAPRANVISYKVCSFFGCSSSWSIAAVDQAIADGVDVLNFSISGPDDPWDNVVDAAFLEAFEAGIFVSASAGNDGPDTGSVAKTAPWNATVAATTHQRVIANVLDVTGPAPVPDELTGLVAVLGDGAPFTGAIEAPLRFADPAGTPEQGCEPFDDGVFDGAIALIKRGGCNFSVKIDNAADAGAVAAVVFNQYAGPPVVMGEVGDTAIASVMVNREDGQALRDLVVAAEDAPVTVRIGTETTLELNDDWKDIVADFSARGPSDFDLLAPAFGAPGRNILAATAADGDDAVQYEMMQGTSMAAPHGAGAGALLTALHPDWSPAEIRSALALGAEHEGLVKEDGTTPADPFAVGSGRLNLDATARVGVVLDETHANFAAADPELGGDPKALNLPALVNQACDESCSWTRTVTSVADVPVEYTVSEVSPEGMPVTATPSSFTLEPGATQELDVAIDVSGVIGGEWAFGAVELSTDATHSPDGLEVSDVRLPLAVVKAEAEIAVAPDSLSSLQDVAQQVPQSVTISSSGQKNLQWQLDDRGAECAVPSWASVSPTSGNVPPDDEMDVVVTFDSTDMTAGDYTATLCFTSNDPHSQMVTVDLELTVIEIPAVDVTDGEIATAQPAGTVTGSSFAIGNAGYGSLDWTLNDEDAGPSEERIQMLHDGVLLVPNSTRSHQGVMAFDPETGALVDPEFIPHFAFDPDSSLYTPVRVLPKLDGSGFLIADQVRWVITEYDLEGNYQGVFAPLSGDRDREVMANIRSMTWTPDDTLLVTVASWDNADSVIELSADGDYLGQFVPAGLDELDSPWDVLIRDDDILVSASSSDAIHSYSLDGKTANERFVDDIPWPEQLVELDNGNVLTLNWGGGTGSAVHEYDAEGELVGRYEAPGRSFTGVHPLGNGNILVSTSSGVYEIDRAGTVLETEYDGGRGRFMTEVRMPDAQVCSTPDDVPWLTVSAADGSVEAGATAEVTVQLDSTGMEAGSYRAQLCVTSDDPDMPLVSVPAEMTVTDEVCTDTVLDAHFGPLAVDSGLLCLGHGSTVAGPLNVSSDGGLFANGTTMNGPLSVHGASMAEVTGTVLNGPMTITGSSQIRLDANHIRGPVTITDNTGETAAVVSDSRINGPLACSGNEPPPTNDDAPNDVTGPKSGQCHDL